jgi:hypothetical protein
MAPKFSLGQLVATPGVLGLGIDLTPYLDRHVSGDWGDLEEEDKAENELSLKEGFRLLSAYNTIAGKFWIITEADRSSTCCLLPEEY